LTSRPVRSRSTNAKSASLQSIRSSLVYVSDDPLRFEEADEVATIDGHAPEIVKDGDKYWLSHAGWFYDGMYLAPIEWKPARRFSPMMRLADSGESDDYLERAEGAKVVRQLLYKALQAGEGEPIEYGFPVPDGVSWISLVFDASGELLVTDKNGTALLDEGDVGEGEPSLHIIELVDPGAWEGGELKVVFNDAAPDPGDGPVVSYVKVYYR